MRIDTLDINELNDRLRELEELAECIDAAEQELREYLADNGDDESDELRELREEVERQKAAMGKEEVEELEKLRDLRDEIGSDRRGLISEDGGPFVAEHDFAEYAREFAEDIGAISGSEGWPLNCIDWEQAAKELATDYSSVEWEGTTYYYRPN